MKEFGITKQDKIAIRESFFNSIKTWLTLANKIRSYIEDGQLWKTRCPSFIFNALRHTEFETIQNMNFREREKLAPLNASRIKKAILSYALTKLISSPMENCETTIKKGIRLSPLVNYLEEAYLRERNSNFVSIEVGQREALLKKEYTNSWKHKEISSHCEYISMLEKYTLYFKTYYYSIQDEDFKRLLLDILNGLQSIVIIFKSDEQNSSSVIEYEFSTFEETKGLYNAIKDMIDSFLYENECKNTA